jgi:GNAT superfamily N-acetyltransferase
VIRSATRGDLAEIGALIRALADYENMADDVVWTLEQLDEHLFGDHPVARVVLACDDTDGAVVGMALWFPTFSTFLGRPGIWLEDLFVRPEARGRGHGLALLQHLRRLTDGRVEWAVLDWNTPSIEFYERLGARPLQGWTHYRWSPEGGAEPPR